MEYPKVLDNEEKVEIYGLVFKQTSTAFPEQYDVFKDNEPVGYVRLRDGFLTVTCPECSFAANTVFGALFPNRQGFFANEQERGIYLRLAALKIGIWKFFDDTKVLQSTESALKELDAGNIILKHSYSSDRGETIYAYQMVRGAGKDISDPLCEKLVINDFNVSTSYVTTIEISDLLYSGWTVLKVNPDEKQSLEDIEPKLKEISRLYEIGALALDSIQRREWWETEITSGIVSRFNGNFGCESGVMTRLVVEDFLKTVELINRTDIDMTEKVKRYNGGRFFGDIDFSHIENQWLLATYCEHAQEFIEALNVSISK